MSTKYQGIDGHHGTVVGTYSSSKRAHTKADQLDAEYGGYRYGVRMMVDGKQVSLISGKTPNTCVRAAQ